MWLAIVVTVFLVTLVLSGATLRMACHLLKASEPSQLTAMGIVFLVMIAGTVVNVVVMVATSGALAPGGRMGPPGQRGISEEQIAYQMIATVANTLVAAGIYRGMIPGVTFLKGMLIYWLQVLVTVAIFALVAVPFYYMGFFRGMF